jgi:hypothetical protein
MFRGLRPDEIDVRVGSISAKGASLLLYKDARCDMNILDETYGVTGWQRKHEVINGNLYCGIGIWNDKINEWVWKWDCGTESYTEKEKGEASDSFKRAAFNIGIGRELYTGGFIFVACPTQKKSTGKGYELENQYQFNGAYVSDIQYKETEHKREIIGLVIKDSKGNQLYAKRGQTVDTGEVTEKEILELFEIAEQAGFTKDTVFKQCKSKYRKETPDKLTKAEYKQLMTGYKKLVKANENK